MDSKFEINGLVKLTGGIVICLHITFQVHFSLTKYRFNLLKYTFNTLKFHGRKRQHIFDS